ncbi:MAG: hypothetical protein NT154_34140 [Verrucomicrobia bacterium]|nr:hypothetical protein [Verrucomicrobiota bacterium]
MTYPINGYPWRRNPVRTYKFHVRLEEAHALFDEVATMPERYPNECLKDDVLWSDQSEKANGITRHKKNGKLCHTLAIYRGPGEAVVYFSMQEDSPALCSSSLYRRVVGLIAPDERISTGTAEPGASADGHVPISVVRSAEVAWYRRKRWL